MYFPPLVTFGPPRTSGMRVDAWLEYLRQAEGTEEDIGQEVLISSEERLQKVLTSRSRPSLKPALLRIRRIPKVPCLLHSPQRSTVQKKVGAPPSSVSEVIEMELACLKTGTVSGQVRTKSSTLIHGKKAVSQICHKIPPQNSCQILEPVVLPSIIRKLWSHESAILPSVEMKKIRRRPKSVLVASFVANMWFDLGILQDKLKQQEDDSIKVCKSDIPENLLQKKDCNPLQRSHSYIVIEEYIMPQMKAKSPARLGDYKCDVPNLRNSGTERSVKFTDELFKRFPATLSDNNRSLEIAELSTSYEDTSRSDTSFLQMEKIMKRHFRRESSILRPCYVIDASICRRHFSHLPQRYNLELDLDKLTAPRLTEEMRWMSHLVGYARSWRSMELSRNATTFCASSQEILASSGVLKTILHEVSDWVNSRRPAIPQQIIHAFANDSDFCSIGQGTLDITTLWSDIRELSASSPHSQSFQSLVNLYTTNARIIDTVMNSTTSREDDFEVDLRFEYDTPILPQDPSSLHIIDPEKSNIGQPPDAEPDEACMESMAGFDALKHPTGGKDGREESGLFKEQKIEETLCKTPLYTENGSDFDSDLESEYNPLGFHSALAQIRQNNMNQGIPTKENKSQDRFLDSNFQFEAKVAFDNQANERRGSTKTGTKPRPTQVVVPKEMITSKFILDVADKSLRHRAMLLLPPPLTAIPSLCIIANTYLQMTGCDHRCLWLHFGPLNDFDFAFQYFSDVLQEFTIRKNFNMHDHSRVDESPQSIIHDNTHDEERVRSGAVARVVFLQADNVSDSEIETTQFSFIVFAVDGNAERLENFLITERMKDYGCENMDTILFIPSGPRVKLSRFLQVMNQIAPHSTCTETLLWHSSDTSVAPSVKFQNPLEVPLVLPKAVLESQKMLENISSVRREVFIKLQKTLRTQTISRTCSIPMLSEISRNEIEQDITRVRASVEANGRSRSIGDHSQTLHQEAASLQTLTELHILKNILFHVTNDGIPVARNFVNHAQDHYTEIDRAFFEELRSKLARVVPTSNCSISGEYTSSWPKKERDSEQLLHPKLRTLLEIIESEKRRMDWEDQTISISRICKTFRALIIAGTSISKDILQEEIMLSGITNETYTVVAGSDLNESFDNSSISDLEFFSGFSLVVFLLNDYEQQNLLPTKVMQLAHANALRLVYVSSRFDHLGGLSSLQEHDAYCERARSSARSKSNFISFTVALNAF